MDRRMPELPCGAILLSDFRHRANAVGHRDINTTEQLCSFCLVLPGLTREHFIPRCRGGTNADANVVPACYLCNGTKGGDTLFIWFPRLQRHWRGDGRFRAGKGAERFAARMRRRLARERDQSPLGVWRNRKKR